MVLDTWIAKPPSPLTGAERVRAYEGVAALRNCSVFSCLPEPTLISVAGHLTERRLKKGAILIREGDPWMGPYLLRSGRIKAFRMSADGRRQMVAFGEAGDLAAVAWSSLGDELPDINDGHQLLTTCAVTDCVLYLMPKELFKDLVLTYPEVAYRAFLLLVRRVHMAFDLAADLSLQRAPQRVAAHLLRLAGERAAGDNAGTELEVAVPRLDLAEAVGATEETVIRILSSFCKQGLIEVHRRKIILVDPAGLARWAEQ